MIIPPRQFVRFMDGRFGKRITIAHLPGDLGAHIGALTSEVWIERPYANKLIRKHKLSFGHFGMIQIAINRGWCRIDRRRESLEFLYKDEEIYKTTFLLAVKSTKEDDGVWIRTLHKSNPSQVRSHLRRGEVLREHAPFEFEE